MKPIYKDRAERWFRVMKSRMKLKDANSFAIWNYWEPAGAWDIKPDGQPKHWVGVHPNAGYYAVDVEAIVDAYEHEIVFTKDDIDHLIATALAGKTRLAGARAFNASIQKNIRRVTISRKAGAASARRRGTWRCR